MTNGNSERLEKSSGHARRLLAVLVGLLATLALIVSGAAPASAQNVVGPQPVAMILTVGPTSTTGQTIVGVRGPPQLRHVSATGVAADTAGIVTYEGGGFSASELNSASTLARQGRSVTLRTADPAVGRTSDLLVDGTPYDVYTLTSGSVDNIVRNVAKKGSQVRGGGVVDLSKSPLSQSDLGNILPRVQGLTGQVSDVIVLP